MGGTADHFVPCILLNTRDFIFLIIKKRGKTYAGSGIIRQAFIPERED